jgi:hypothetical protein
LIFELSQKTEDIYILEEIKHCLGTGNLFLEKRGISKLKIGNIQDIQHILIPFFINLFFERF